jgi:uncharacterized membrane protein YqjE
MDMNKAGPEEAHSKGVGELVRAATEQVSGLVRAEVTLAKVEAKEKAREAALGAGLLAGAALLGFFVLAAVLTSAAVGLSHVLPLWASLLVVAGMLCVAAAGLGLAGRKRLQQGAPPVPTQAIESVKADVAALKAGVKH